ncbi:MAG: hypothetical protein H8D78_07745 [Chloroflexi bacterium]|nr:hypothetical protein [Chloroflexota bacterium]
MDKVIVACVQQRLRLHEDLDGCRRDLARFLRTAQAKKAQLIVFPELLGTMAVSPLLQGLRAGLLRRADQGRRTGASLWTRTKSKVADTTAGVLKADLRQNLSNLLVEDPGLAWDAYRDLFAGAAQEYDMTVVAGSGYLLDEASGGIVNQAVVFGPEGNILGRQAKVSLSADDTGLAVPGAEWSAVDTEVGRIGLLLGNDALYPEAARILAYQGAQILIGLGACPGAGLHRKVRDGLLARVQENQLYGMISFLVGHNALGLGERQEYAGQSAIFAPAEFTLRYSGVMVELGTASSEGVITAEWDFGALRELWAESDTPLRRAMPMTAFRSLGDRYGEGRTLHEMWQALPPEGAAPPLLPEVVPVDALLEIGVAPPEPPIEELPPLPEELPEELWAEEEDMADAILEELLAEDIPMMPEWGQEGDEEPIEPEEADA